MQQHSKGFSIVELLVVIAVIGLLISLLIPAIQAAREAARRSQCASNMRQLALATLNYHDTLKSFPPGNIVHEHLVTPETICCFSRNTSARGIYCGMIGWPAFLLPFMEETTLYESISFEDLAYLPDKFHFGVGCASHLSAHGSQNNLFAATHMPPTFTCPSAMRLAPPKTHKDYAANGATVFAERTTTGGVFFRNSGTRMSDIKRGTTNTFLILESSHAWWWTPPKSNETHFTQTGVNPFFWVHRESSGYIAYMNNYPFEPPPDLLLPINTKTNWMPTVSAHSFHPKGTNASLCDGSVSFFSEKMDIIAYINLFPISGGDIKPKL